MSRIVPDNRYRPEQIPDWSGIVMRSRDVVGEKSIYLHRGYRYCTYGEVTLARLLTAQGIDFTPDVQFPFFPKRKRRVRSYVADFVFNRNSYVWTEEDGTEIVVHGLECKGAYRKSRKAGTLYGERGIHIIVLCEAEIDLYKGKGQLPLRIHRRFAG